LEQINPVPLTQLKAVLKKYNKAKKHYWVQEEPENMGAWTYIARKFRDVNLDVISRHETSSPATGSPKRHEKRSKILYDKIFACAKTIKATATV
jgi:2-oxoglutarate dehydrogenase E1 component